MWDGRFTPRGPPLVRAYEISNLAKDYWISRKISGFPERFLDFLRFLDFWRDFWISGEISGYSERFLDFQTVFEAISSAYCPLGKCRYCARI